MPTVPGAISAVDARRMPVYMRASSGPALRARGGRLLPLAKAGQTRF
jgi:hypothetical protein